MYYNWKVYSYLVLIVPETFLNKVINEHMDVFRRNAKDIFQSPLFGEESVIFHLQMQTEEWNARNIYKISRIFAVCFILQTFS